jgi:ferredoxin
MKRIADLFRILPSTAAFYREARRRPEFNWKEFIHGYVYGRWPYLYIGIGTGEHPLVRLLEPLAGLLARWWSASAASKAPLSADSRQPLPSPRRDTGIGARFAETYHGKVLLPDAARRLVSVDRDIRLTRLETVVPFAMARDLILNQPDHIVLLDCPCRSSRAKPCLPLDVCLVIGEPFAAFIAEHHPDRSRRIAPDEAVQVLTDAAARGNVHHAFFKEAMLGRFYAICNCCACCCGAMQAWRNGVPMLAASGYIAEIDVGRCAGCGSCVDACQFEALRLEAGTAALNPSACMGCGLCVTCCPQRAIRLSRHPAGGDPLDVGRLLAGGPAESPLSATEARLT